MKKRTPPQSDFEWAEDVCEICDAHVGYGIRLLHLGRCDEHAEEPEG